MNELFEVGDAYVEGVTWPKETTKAEGAQAGFVD